MSVVLVVAAHPDDEVLGPGGTLARHVHEGDEVHAVIASEGATCRYPDGLAETLGNSCQKAAATLGLASVRQLNLPDQRLDVLPLIEITQLLEQIVSEVRAEVLYTHHQEDVNADHGIVARAAWTACRPYAAPWLRRFAVYETPSSTEWAWPTPDAAFRPTLYVDVGAQLQTKLDAMACYDTELREYPHPRSLRALAERAAYWGSHVGLEAAEVFHVVREVAR